ncbi:MAG: CHAT domain-containing protein, partial [Candidatus Methylumidiphilus alinenensis]
MERVLVLYANPADTDRIRLDKEHRAIDQALLT